jgi:hypothetical protein
VLSTLNCISVDASPSGFPSFERVLRASKAGGDCDDEDDAQSL